MLVGLGPGAQAGAGAATAVGRSAGLVVVAGLLILPILVQNGKVRHFFFLHPLHRRQAKLSVWPIAHLADWRSSPLPAVETAHPSRSSK